MYFGISGATGYLGKFLVSRFKETQHNLIGFSRTASGGFFALSDQEALDRCESFIHLGEPANIQKFNDDPNSARAFAFAYVTELAEKFGPNLLYFSSAAVYGTKTEDRHSVSSDVTPYDSYTEMKLRHEEVVLEHAGRVLRLSNIFGLGMSSETVIPRLAKQIIAEEVIDLRNNPIRDYLHIDDFASALRLLLERNDSGIFNIGSGIARSIEDLVDVICHSLQIQDVQTKRDDPTWNGIDCLVLDIRDTCKKLGWMPKNDFADQIMRSLIGEEDREN